MTSSLVYFVTLIIASIVGGLLTGFIFRYFKRNPKFGFWLGFGSTFYIYDFRIPLPSNLGELIPGLGSALPEFVATISGFYGMLLLWLILIIYLWLNPETSQVRTRPIASGVSDLSLEKPRTLWGDTWRQFQKHRLAMAASILLALIVFGVRHGPNLWTLDPEYIDIVDAYSEMTLKHPMGADQLGRDSMARVITGGRISLLIGISAMAIAMSLGTSIGLLAGYFNRFDNILMRITDMFLSLPVLPLLLVITTLFREPLRAALGPEAGIFILTVSVIGALGWMPTARLVRGEVLTMKERDFVVAARSLGSSNPAIIVRHILPNVLSPVIVAATFSVARAIITESALSFLGLGFPPDFPTWGRVLFDGQGHINKTFLLVFWPGLMISLTVLCVNFIGDGLRDALDPRLRK